MWEWLAESILYDVLTLTTPMTRGELLLILFFILVAGYGLGWLDARSN